VVSEEKIFKKFTDGRRTPSGGNSSQNLILSKNDQDSKIYLPCNFEVNLITHLEVIALFSSIFFKFCGKLILFYNERISILFYCEVGKRGAVS
jgi:hypothetical protein